MAWTWRLEDSAGAVVQPAGELPTFASQSDAESWLGEIWRELVESGATQASLLDDSRVVYGPMSLMDE